MEKRPISRYIGKFPNGYWEFIEEFTGDEKLFAEHIQELQKIDPTNQYRCWDNREEI